ncbi:52 kDa repressor of the inhibitor of the protein kinase-like [Hydractinia symbiolongicarpus]|uniref:52 kDa repressor of the inhibitor of the protein kinase-like n=1 Tax=Hydractinia symbiolongicarpus TaxID=13093 RepID=UPI00254A739C|nr:52 kDa repressor of the inhibitor of the protein kinase-like [Hydractinia symbiolongicarpus]
MKADLHIMFFYEGLMLSSKFQSNHFVPLVHSSLKRKTDQSLKLCFPKKVFTDGNMCVGGNLQTKLNFLTKPIVKTYESPAITSSISTISKNCSTVDSTEPEMVYVCENDVGSFRKKVAKLKESDIRKLITNLFIPDNTYNFPVSNRKFQYKWLSDFSWLAYSPTMDGAFCLPCVLFGDRFPSKSYKVTKLFSEPQKHWPDAVPSFKRHCSSKQGLHVNTSLLFNSFIDNMSGARPSIDTLIDQNLQKSINDNRQKLIPIIDTIILCGRIGIALRGHRDGPDSQPKIGEYSQGGAGNFRELLNFRVRAGDNVLKEHLQSASKNATYISKTSQNALISCCGSVISDTIVNEIKRNKFFSIIADEAADCSNKEQMSLVLRFVDSSCDIREDFIRYIYCEEGLAGKDLASVLLKCVSKDLSLDILNCRGQGYDGAGSVSGHINGLSAHILRINRKAIYTHCHSHRLNLSVCGSCSIQSVKNTLERVKELSYFFNLSQVRQQLLEANILRHCPEAKKKKLIDVCRTRWIERIIGLDIFQELFVAIVYTLEDMSMNLDKKCNRDTSTKATSLLHLVTNFDFIVSLVVTRSVMDLLLPVTKILQGKTIDLLSSLHLIQSLKNMSLTIRASANDYHNNWYKEAVSLASTVRVQENRPRVCSRQVHRSNVSADTISSYYLRSLTIPILDHLSTELSKRFEPSSLAAYAGLAVIPSNMISLLYLWEEYWTSYKFDAPDNVSSTLKLFIFLALKI